MAQQYHIWAQVSQRTRFKIPPLSWGKSFTLLALQKASLKAKKQGQQKQNSGESDCINVPIFKQKGSKQVC